MLKSKNQSAVTMVSEPMPVLEGVIRFEEGEFRFYTNHLVATSQSAHALGKYAIEHCPRVRHDYDLGLSDDYF